nr:hypothetical protein [Tanacetum cinerariifolium]
MLKSVNIKLRGGGDDDGGGVRLLSDDWWWWGDETKMGDGRSVMERRQGEEMAWCVVADGGVVTAVRWCAGCGLAGGRRSGAGIYEREERKCVWLGLVNMNEP